jgi:TctA family transporter
MFLPDYLLMGFNQAKVLGPPTAALGTGTDVQPFVKEINQVFKASAPLPKYFNHAHGFFLAFIVLVALTTFWQLKQRKTGYSLDILLFALTGLLGCILLFCGLAPITNLLPKTEYFVGLPAASPGRVFIAPAPQTRIYKVLFPGNRPCTGADLYYLETFTPGISPGRLPDVLLLAIRPGIFPGPTKMPGVP